METTPTNNDPSQEEAEPVCATCAQDWRDCECNDGKLARATRAL